MKLLISIVTWNNEKEIDMIMDSLMSLQCDFDFGVVISDNASTDNTRNIIKSSYSNQVLLIENPENIGFGYAHNLVIKRFEADYYLILNPDCYVEDEKSLQKLVDFADENPDAWAIGPKLLNSDGTVQYSVRSFPDPIAALFRNTFLDKIFPDNPFTRKYIQRDIDHDQIAEADWISGAVMLLKRDTITKIGGFDERYFMYVEDMDLCKEIHLRNKKVIYFPSSIFYHKIGASSDKAVKAMVKEHHKSMYLYYKKFANPFAAKVLGSFVYVLIWLRMKSILRRS